MAVSPYLFNKAGGEKPRRSVSPNQQVWDRMRLDHESKRSSRVSSGDGYGSSFLDMLPSDACIRIFLYLSVSDIGIAAQVCREWRRYAYDKTLWKTMCKARWRLSYWGPQSAAYTALEESQNNDWRGVYKSRLSVERRWGSGDCRVVTLPVRAGSLDSVVADDALLAVGCESGDLSVWDIRTGVLARVHVMPAMIAAMALEQGGVAAIGLWSGVAVLFDLDSGAVLQGFLGHTEGIRVCRLTDKLLLTGSFDTTVRVWDRATGECLQVLSGHAGGVTGLVVDQSRRISAALDGSVCIWGADSGALEARLVHPTQQGLLCLAADEAVIAAGAQDGSLLIWSAVTLELLAMLPAEPLAGGCTALALVGDRLCSGHEDGAVRVWSLSRGALACTLRGHTDAVAALAADDTKVVSTGAAADSSVRVWDFAYDCGNVDPRTMVVRAGNVDGAGAVASAVRAKGGLDGTDSELSGLQFERLAVRMETDDGWAGEGEYSDSEGAERMVEAIDGCDIHGIES
eukprot:c3884_g1_i1.p1 GENE.c3884_g1_i1~~c3884_g1_i1.p1  ORF type:complete len:535 (+),score=72.15 c3884_g1_i1:66-1607(+)